MNLININDVYDRNKLPMYQSFLVAGDLLTNGS